MQHISDTGPHRRQTHELMAVRYLMVVYGPCRLLEGKQYDSQPAYLWDCTKDAAVFELVCLR